MVAGSSPGNSGQSFLRRFANSNQSKANLIVRTARLGSASIRELEERIHEAIRRADLPA